MRRTIVYVSAAAGVVALIVGAYVIRYVTAPVRGVVAQREATQADPHYRISAYDRFFDDCQAITAKERILANYADQLADLDDEDAPGRARLSAAITAETNVREELIAAYNADAAKAGTRAQFLDSSLPYSIDPEGTTSCTL